MPIIPSITSSAAAASESVWAFPIFVVAEASACWAIEIPSCGLLYAVLLACAIRLRSAPRSAGKSMGFEALRFMASSVELMLESASEMSFAEEESEDSNEDISKAACESVVFASPNSPPAICVSAWDRRVVPLVATAVAEAAMKEGVARLRMGRKEISEELGKLGLLG